MITANELRCGNILMSHLTNKPTVVDWLVIKHVADGNIQSAYDQIPVYFSIPLTEELLIKAGFEKATDYWKGFLIPMGNEGCKIRIRQNEDGWFFSFNDGTLYIQCRYLHQLQNLYFALTVTELEISISKHP